MIRCTACSADGADGMKFCGTCGAALAASCPSCAFVNPAGNSFCGSCGSPLRPSAPPVAAPLERERTAERRQITVLFCDLVGSTALADRLDPEELRDVVRAYQQASADVIAHAGGNIAQYLGDGLLVYFGYPRAHEDDARRAVHAALGIVRAITQLGATMEVERGISLAVRCAIHTGSVVTGNVGAKGTEERLAVGSAPNIAARLQADAPPGAVFLTGDTQRLVTGWFELESLGPRKLQGVSAPVEVFRAIGEVTAGSRSELDAATRLSPLVGRSEELALLRRRLEMAGEGTAQVVLLSGEAGIGKSRLVQELRKFASEDGFGSIVCRCSSYHESSALHPVIEMVETVFGIERDDSAATRVDKMERALTPLGVPLAQYVPPLASLLSIPAGDAYPLLQLTPHKLKERILEALVTLLRKAAERRRLFFVVEDLHWADPSTHDFLSVLISQPPTSRMFTLMTVRADHPVASASRSNVTRVTINRLTDVEVTAMVERLAEGSGLPEKVVREVVSRTDGVPVFVEELTRMVLDSRATINSLSTPAERLLGFAIPSTLRDSLLARLDLMAEAKEVGQLAAVLGREFSYALLSAVAGLDDETLGTQLARLVDAELLYQRGVPPNATYTFKHALIQDAAYDLLLKTTRRQFHLRIAGTLAAHFPDIVASGPELLAHHLTEAGATGQAAGAWLQAGMHALHRSANLEAIVHLRRGLELVVELPASHDRNKLELALLTTLGPAISATRGFSSPEVESVYERARVLGEDLRGAPEVFWAIHGLWAFYFTCGNLPRALSVAEQILHLAEAANVTELLMDAHWAIAVTSYYVADFERSLREFDSTLACETPGRDLTGMAMTGMDVLTNAHSFSSIVLCSVGDIAEAERRAQRGIAIARDLNHPLSLAFALYFAACLAQMRGNRAAVLELTSELIPLSKEQGVFFEPLGVLIRGWARGDTDEMRAGLERVLQAATALWLSYFHSLIAETHLAAGQLPEAREQLDLAFAAVHEKGERCWLPELHRLRGEILVADGDETAARKEFTTALALAQEMGTKMFVVRATESLAAIGVEA